jgi:PTS system mannose-specific IIA component
MIRGRRRHPRPARRGTRERHKIVGDLQIISIGGTEVAQDARQEIASAIDAVSSPEGVIIATDMFGGTPANLGITFLETGKIEVVTGVNLPMLIKLAGLRDTSNVLDAARQIREHGRNAIWVASDLLSGAGGTSA